MISSDEIIGFKRVLTLWLKVDVLRMLLFAHFVHAKGRLIRINIVQHVGILISSQPFVFPVKSEGLCSFEVFAEILLTYVDGVNPGRLTFLHLDREVLERIRVLHGRTVTRLSHGVDGRDRVDLRYTGQLSNLWLHLF